jgi:hypothetical protein
MEVILCQLTFPSPAFSEKFDNHRDTDEKM